ncbi:Crp/Fnr family transcriptional regulator [Deinococcus oregonensis]|uniref:Crp/Fnr family transcriptional regulator n=1 Tax=Deinococcus oregonensis TaxID=1805970 RepID=A0ABV6B6B4_9DEIO
MSRLEVLRRSPLFQNVPEEAMRDALQILTPRTFRPGEVVLSQDVSGDALHLITSGAVRVSRVSLGHRERVMGDIYAPGMVGETSVLSHQQRSATVTALTDVTTLMLYREHFEVLLNRHPRVLWNLAAMLVQRVTNLNDELIAFGLNTEAALAHVFTTQYRQRLAAGVPNPEVLPLGTQDIMQRISASRETVARVMKKLEGQRLIEVTARTVHLLDLEGLGAVPLEDGDGE